MEGCCMLRMTITASVPICYLLTDLKPFLDTLCAPKIQFLCLFTLFLRSFLPPPLARKCRTLYREVEKQQFLTVFTYSRGVVVLLLRCRYQYISLPNENNMT